MQKNERAKGIENFLEFLVQEFTGTEKSLNTDDRDHFDDIAKEIINECGLEKKINR
jgi:hypothetical protein